MDRHLPRGLHAALWAAALAAPMFAAAAPFPDDAMAVYGGYGRVPESNGSDAPSVGILLPWKGWATWTPGPGISWYTDVFASRWMAHGEKSRSVTVVGAIAVGRHRFSQGSSPWFVEAGLGATLMDRLYLRDDKRFSTTFNFVSQVGAGRSFGGDGRHEVALRVQHYSNASVKKPNPGENIVQLRYAYRF